METTETTAFDETIMDDTTFDYQPESSFNSQEFYLVDAFGQEFTDHVSTNPSLQTNFDGSSFSSSLQQSTSAISYRDCNQTVRDNTSVSFSFNSLIENSYMHPDDNNRLMKSNCETKSTVHNVIAIDDTNIEIDKDEEEDLYSDFQCALMDEDVFHDINDLHQTSENIFHDEIASYKYVTTDDTIVNNNNPNDNKFNTIIDERKPKKKRYGKAQLSQDKRKTNYNI